MITTVGSYMKVVDTVKELTSECHGILCRLQHTEQL